MGNSHPSKSKKLLIAEHHTPGQKAGYAAAAHSGITLANGHVAAVTDDRARPGDVAGGPVATVSSPGYQRNGAGDGDATSGASPPQNSQSQKGEPAANVSSPNQNNNNSSTFGQTTQLLELRHILQPEQYAGILNAGNTCYLSSVVQALYACAPFRQAVLSYTPLIGNASDLILKENTSMNSSITDATLSTISSTLPRSAHSTNTPSATSSSARHRQKSGTNSASAGTLQKGHKSGASLSAHALVDSSYSSLSMTSSQLTQSTSLRVPPMAHQISSAQLADLVGNAEIGHVVASDSSSQTADGGGEAQPLVRSAFHKKQLGQLSNDNMIVALRDLYESLHDTRRKKPGKFDAKRFINRFQHEHEMFKNFMQHDAHEFWNTLINCLSDTLENENTVRVLALQAGTFVPDLMSTSLTSDAFFDRPQSKKDSKKKSKIKFGLGRKKKSKGKERLTSVNETVQITNALLETHIEASVHGGDRYRDLTTQNDPKISHSRTSSIPSSKGTAASALRSPSSCSAAQIEIEIGETENMVPLKPEKTWVKSLFGGTLVNETRCLSCHTVSAKEEQFTDLSVDIEADSSLLHCLQTFCNTETLTGDQKYFCECCGCKVEAHKRMRIKSVPQILCVHLKRFKYNEQLDNMGKLSSRVAFPEQLRISDLMQKGPRGTRTKESPSEPDPLFKLISLVIHCGQGPNRGHYIAACRITEDRYLILDDDETEIQSTLEDFYGVTSNRPGGGDAGYTNKAASCYSTNDHNVVTPGNHSNSAETAYILFYQQLSRIKRLEQ